MAALAEEVCAIWSVAPTAGALNRSTPQFAF
jgi:hypothetical protein